MYRILSLVIALAIIVLVPPLAGAQIPTLKIAVLEIGTVNWEMRTIKEHNIDRDNGFNLDVRGMAGGPASKIALQGGEVDAIVSDWLWVARQRAEGKNLIFIPYSKAVGGVMVPSDSDAQSLADLVGGKIGIAGGPLDKSWLIINAYAKQTHGLDLSAETEQVFGAPPLIFKNALSGDLDGAINFWHFMAKMDAAGMRRLISTGEAAEALGLDPEMPLLGYVLDGKLLETNPDLVESFRKTILAAKKILAEDDSQWDRLREHMNASNDNQFEALKQGFRAGIPGEDSVKLDSARRMFNLMLELTGDELVGSATELPEGVFYEPQS